MTRSRVAGSSRRFTHASSPPSCTQGGIAASRPVRAGDVGVHVRADARSRRARSFDPRDRPPPSSASSPGPRPSGGRPRRAPWRRARSRSARRSPRGSGWLSLRMCATYPPPSSPPALVSATSSGGLRIEGRRVDQRGADAERAFAHRLADQVLHARELIRRRLAVGVAQLVDAHGGCADEAGDVGADAACDEPVEVLAERRPVDVVLDVALLLLAPLSSWRRSGAHRPALAEDLQRDALADVALRPAVRDQRVGRPGQHVDEAGSDGHPFRVHRPSGPRCGEVAHGGDLVPAHAHVGAPAPALRSRRKRFRYGR